MSIEAKKIFPSLVLTEREIKEHAKKIFEILELDVTLRDGVIVLHPPRKNSSKIHKKFYEEFYNYYQRR